MLAARAVVFFVLTTASLAAHGSGEWTLKKSTDDIRIYYRTTDDGYTEFRGVTRVRTSLSALVALFYDVQSMPNWVHRILEARKLEQIGAQEAYAYIAIRMPWPFRNRDVLVHSTLEQDPRTLAVTIRGANVGGRFPERSQYVRVRKIRSHWAFSPQADGSVEVAFQGYGDAGGNLDSVLMRWAIDLVLWESPLKTLQGLRQMIVAPEYQNSSLAFIREPD
ncbi:MAG: START domain-containing protein [Gammaproteobacteria bacterium]|nr:START domain-containing protein [Gammaproteobacteria bacterium]